MKKRVSLLLCVLAASIGFAGCSQKTSDTEYDQAALEQLSESILQGFSQMGDTDFQQFQELSELELELTMMQIGIPVDGEAFLSMIDSWKAAETECGEYVQHGGYEVEKSGDGFTVSTMAEYEDREAEIVFTIDEKMNIESMDVSAKYSIAEILKKAGLNTVLGMGTVFAVLIFLAFLISLMKYIPMLIGKKKETPEAKPAVEEVVAVEEDYTDDLELVAVISAAIAAQTGSSTDGFVVRSIKRRASNNWN